VGTEIDDNDVNEDLELLKWEVDHYTDKLADAKEALREFLDMINDKRADAVAKAAADRGIL